MTKFLICIACTALTACTIQSGQTAQQPQSQPVQPAQSQLVGMTKEQVLSCVGQPLEKATEGQSEVWSYSSGNDRTGVAEGNGAAVATGSCTVKVVIVFGRVSQVNYSGPTGELLSNGDQCAFAVQNCVQR
jgi:outer membrane protein assembly factor BamE (lipoprotein component of BamABCDE complex)